MTSHGNRRAARERGVTLIELMIALVVASLLVGMIFSIYVRMAAAYRAETIKAELQQTVQSCPATIADEVRVAGFQITRFRIASGSFGSTETTDLPPVMVDNDADGWGPDLLRVFYADPTAITAVTGITSDRQAITVEDNSAFIVSDIVALIAPTLVDPGDGSPPRAEYDACVLAVTGKPDATTVEVSGTTGAPWNTSTNSHCDVPVAAIGTGQVQLALFHARAYRIDPEPSRRAIGVFQMSPTAGIEAGDWVDLGIGFTDLQVATRYAEPGDTADVDQDGDPEHDWYSGDDQEGVAPATARPANSQLVQVSVGVAVRTHTEIQGVGSSATPAFIDDSDPSLIPFNPFGDSPSIDLTQDPSALPVQHRGRHIYRSTQMVIDVRNMGVGL